MSKTPETDAEKLPLHKYPAAEGVEVVDAEFAAQLEIERDEAREKLKNTYNYICLHHTDRERSDLVTGCPICKLDQLRKVADELKVTWNTCTKDMDSLPLHLNSTTPSRTSSKGTNSDNYPVYNNLQVN